MNPYLSVENLSKKYHTFEKLFSASSVEFYAVDNVSLSVEKGKNLGIVGQSGSGKTTLAGIIAGIITPDSGSLYFEGKPVDVKDGHYRRNVQMVFQNPDQSLNPRLKVYSVLYDLLMPRLKNKQAVRKEAERLMEITGLASVHLDRYPSELSGGQKQRVSIARALALEPGLIIADEPVSSLDVSVQAQILNLMDDLNKELGITFILISHDLSVVSWLCDEVAVMHNGKIVETGAAEKILSRPEHSYTKELIKSAYMEG